MTYELAAATALIATHCALCGRPLLDAPSVERGIGPVCAQRAGAGDAQSAADFDGAVAAAVRATFASASWAAAVATGDARRGANVLTAAVAAEPQSPRVPHLLAAVSALGFGRLSAALAAHLVTTITVAAEGDRLAVTTDRLDGETFGRFVAAVRGVPGRRWDGDRKVNTFPATARRALWGALRGAMPAGTVVLGARLAVL